ncbi:MAG: S-methyl-5-thioribose-1-phosphate isomerase [Candidatus Omnitrophica bacterium]|nr:S-methyl-5-thioribose-1-phosphate isomerase [Candidatus Omnitrophota bacterium]
MQALRWSKNRLILLDQRKLPFKHIYVECRDVKSIWKAIHDLTVRGAPLIGVTAGFGVYLGIKDSRATSHISFKKDLKKVLAYLATARPTAVNLFWTLERMRNLVEENRDKTPLELKKIILQEAHKILEEDRRIFRQMADFGDSLINPGDRILTYCNTGALAAVEYGTALGAIYYAKERGKRIEVFACETRPFLQGARLTCWELKENKIPVTLISDNMAAALMTRGKVDKVFVGSDRTVANGDTANKIGTYNLAVLAHYHKIPFYVFCPLSSFDFKLKTGKEIPIEERPAEELIYIMGKRIAPYGVKAYYPAFDITPGKLITAIVTERGIFSPPYLESLRKLKEFITR